MLSTNAEFFCREIYKTYISSFYNRYCLKVFLRNFQPQTKVMRRTHVLFMSMCSLSFNAFLNPISWLRTKRQYYFVGLVNFNLVIDFNILITYSKRLRINSEAYCCIEPLSIQCRMQLNPLVLR